MKMMSLYVGQRKDTWNYARKCIYIDTNINFILSISPIFSHALRYLFLCSGLLSMCTKTSDVVIDCFAGAGNMARACEDLGRHCISIDMDKECYDCSLCLIGNHFLPEELLDDSPS